MEAITLPIRTLSVQGNFRIKCINVPVNPAVKSTPRVERQIDLDSTGLADKGDHFVGDYYVRFDKEYRAEVKQLMEEKGLEDSQQNVPIKYKS